MYTWITINSIADLSKLENFVSTEYNPIKVAKRLQDGISNAVKGLLIEHNYNDKDYRSTYYNFYAKKGRKYNQDCVRLHFFDGAVTYEEGNQDLKCDDNKIVDHYFGYMVLRPTGIATIGRSVVSPDVRSLSGFTITANHNIHLLGYTLTVQGFPSMDQHIDISVCAHVACWSILRHYSERYSTYREHLVHDITLMTQEFNPGGLVPSKGLTVSHAERVFQKAGTFPLFLERIENNGPSQQSHYEQDPSFYRQLVAYVESGFPLFAANHSDSHAFAVIGYEWRAPVNEHHTETRYTWDELKSLIVIDDNYLPYFTISANNRVPLTPYCAEDIDTFLVALPDKVFYSADAVDKFAPSLRLFESIISLPPENDTIIRYFMTTGTDLRRFMRNRASEFDPNLLKAVMMLPFAQHLWIIEFASQSEWASGQISARAVLDATASSREDMPLWLFHGRFNALIYDRRDVDFGLNNLNVLKLSGMENTAFTRIDQNLRPIQRK